MDPKLEETLEKISAQAATALSDRLLALVLYGSAVSGDYRPGRSDLNLLFLLDRVDAAALEALLKPLAGWRKKNSISPLLLDRDDLNRSQDSFPLEFLEIRLAHRVLKGDDPIAALSIDRDALRLQCERETRGKVILLQQGFLDAGADRKARQELFRASIKPVIAIMRAMLWLTGNPTPPAAAAEVPIAFENIYGRPVPHLRRALDFRFDPPRLAAPELAALFVGYLAELKDLSRWIDRWEPAK